MAISTITVGSNMGNGFKTEIDCSNNFIIDQPKAAGGTDEGPNPLEVFLSSLGGCICAIGRIISTQKRLEVERIDVKIEGDIDKDFLLGKTKEGRAGFTEIRAFVDVKADMSHSEKEVFVKEIQKRCPIADNILNTSVIAPQVLESAEA